MASTPLTFRKATADDVPSLVKLIQSAYRGDSSRKGWTTEANLLNGARIDAAGVAAKMALPDTGVIIVAHDEQGRLAACCEVQRQDQPQSNPETDRAYFGLFAVDPERQAGGLGRNVLAEAERFVRDEWRCARLEMLVIMVREELIAWYVRRGYRLTGEKRPFPYAQLVDGGGALRDDMYFVVLEKDLRA